jgi:hypothetical protein
MIVEVKDEPRGTLTWLRSIEHKPKWPLGWPKSSKSATNSFAGPTANTVASEQQLAM